MAKAGRHHRAAVDTHTLLALGISTQLKGALNHAGEVLLAVGALIHALHARIGHGAGDEHAVSIARLGRHEAVRGEHHGRGNVGEVGLLGLPSAAKVTLELRVRLERGICMAGQHLAVGVHVDTAAVGLLKKLLQVGQVMAGNHHERTGFHRELHLRGCRRAEMLEIAFIEQAHAGGVDPAGLKHERQQRICPKVVAQGSQATHEEGVYLGVCRLTKNASVIGVRRDTAHAKEEKRLQAAHVFLSVPHLSHVKLGHRGRAAGGVSRALAHLSDEDTNVIGVEVDVGQRGKERMLHERRGAVAHGGLALGAPRAGQSHKRARQLILQAGNLGCLSAHAGVTRACLAASSLLALKTEHPTTHGDLPVQIETQRAQSTGAGHACLL